MRKAAAPPQDTAAVHDARKAHRSVEHKQGEKTWHGGTPWLSIMSATAPHAVLAGHNFVPAEECPTASTRDDLFLLLNGEKFKGKRGREGTGEMMTLLTSLSDGTLGIYSFSVFDLTNTGRQGVRLQSTVRLGGKIMPGWIRL